MAIYDSTDHKLGDYLLGKATGYYDNAYSSLGAEHYRHTQKLRDEALSITYRPSQSGPGIFDDAFAEAGDFGSEWAETIIEYGSGAFTWVPAWTGTVLKLICVFLFLVAGVQYEFTGWGLLLVAGSGWFAPRITAGLLKMTLSLSLSLVYLAFILLVAALVLGLTGGAFYLLGVLFA